MSILDWVPFFDSLSWEDKQHLSYFCQKKDIAQGDELFHQWDSPTAFYVVVSWSFSVFKEIDGQTQELWPVEVWDILWEMSLFGQNENRNATVVAKENSTLITILDFSIQELVKTNPDILEKIQKVIEKRVK